MIKKIHFNGLSTSPSEGIAPDGDLALSLNLINEENAILPIPNSTPLFSVPGGCCIYQHHTSTYTHFICWKSQSSTITFEVLDANGHTIQSLSATDTHGQPVNATITSFIALGNTLICAASDTTHYFLWRETDKTYTYLGSTFPSITIDFNLTGDVVARQYASSAINLVKASSIKTDENQWRILSSQDVLNITYKLPPGATWATFPCSDFIDIKNITSLEKNKEYRFSFYTISGYAKHVQLYSDDKLLFEQVCSGGSAQKAFVADNDYSDLKIRFLTTPSDKSSHISGSVVIETSDIFSETSHSRLQYDNDSFQAAMAAINSFVAGEATDKDLFIFPFFVRYALRFYDGSNVAVSAPMLMTPNSGYAPFIYFRDTAPHLSLRAFVSSLQYAVTRLSDRFADWKDLITAVDIFVSQPIYPFDQGAEFDPNKSYFSYSRPESCGNYGILRLRHGLEEVTNGDYRFVMLHPLSEKYFGGEAYQPEILNVAKKTSDDIAKTISSISSFYLISSIEFEKIVSSNEFVNLPIEDGTLASLVARPRLDADDNLYYRGYTDASMFVYNNRLHIFDTSIILPAPHSLALVNQQARSSSNLYPCHWVTFVYLHTNQGDKIVTSAHDGILAWACPMRWFFYPDSRAYRAVCVRYDDGGWGSIYDLKLSSFNSINGAYAFSDDFDSEIFSDSDLEQPQWTPPQPDNIMLSPSTIFVSPTSNPFIFKAASTVSVGAGHLLALSSAAKALSQGQFGQFPLYAFTSEGVWALETTTTGAYAARQPITRDVLMPGSVPLQLDSEVLFASNRGLMLLSGSNTRCISDTIGSIAPFDLRSLPGIDELHNLIGVPTDNCIPTFPLNEFLKSSGMLYEYTHQHIIIFNPGKTYAYVFSLKSNAWGMMHSSILSAVNSYPDALAIDKDCNLVNFSSTSDDTPRGLLITRPLSLEAPDVLKTIDTVIQRGHFQKGHIQTVLYGSRDLHSWHIIASSTDHRISGHLGTPYKYFRVALLCTLSPGESVNGAEIQFSPRYTNRLR